MPTEWGQCFEQDLFVQQLDSIGARRRRGRRNLEGDGLVPQVRQSGLAAPDHPRLDVFQHHDEGLNVGEIDHGRLLCHIQNSRRLVGTLAVGILLEDVGREILRDAGDACLLPVEVARHVQSLGIIFVDPLPPKGTVVLHLPESLESLGTGLARLLVCERPLVGLLTSRQPPALRPALMPDSGLLFGEDLHSERLERDGEPTAMVDLHRVSAKATKESKPLPPSTPSRSNPEETPSRSGLQEPFATTVVALER